MCKSNILTIVAVAILALALGQVQAGTINVPNGTFHMYKPGTTNPVVSWGPEGYQIWVQQIGMNRPLSGNSGAPDNTPGYVTFADGTTGTNIDCPGWITPIESSGSPTNTCDLFTPGYDTTDGSSVLNAFGEWSGQNGNLAESAESLGIIAINTTYTVSGMLEGNAGAFTLELRADGVPMPVSSSVNPISEGSGTAGWEVISTTYDSLDIAAYVGQSLTIVAGTKRPGPEDPNLYGQRSRLDNITLTTVLTGRQGAARRPNPPEEATNVGIPPTLSWTPGDFVQELNEHDVYLGETFDEVNDATSSDHPNVTYENRDVNNFDAGTLEFGKTYYWRIDEVNDTNAASPWKGFVWSFTTDDHAVVEDFELYEWDRQLGADANWVYYVWVDGLANFLYLEDMGGNDTGANIFTQEGTVLGGIRGLRFDYSNNGFAENPRLGAQLPRLHKWSKAKAQIANLPSGISSDWTVSGIRALSISFYGDSLNDVEPMWVELTDGAGGLATVTYGDYEGEDPNHITEGSWHEWNIDLQDFRDGGVNLTDVNSIAIGFGTEGDEIGGGYGFVYFDEIVLYPSRCLRMPLVSEGNHNDDCMIDFTDFAIMAENYLAPGMWP